MTFRKEIKFKLSNSDSISLKAQLIDCGMKVLYPMRRVNSCYFDNYDYLFLSHSQNGIVPRKKIRLRWYNNNCLINKETKITSIEGRFKTIEPHQRSKIKSFSKLNIFDAIYGNLTPSIFITYSREYYIYKGLRLTFDGNIIYQNLRSILGQEFKDNERVMEIKTSINTPDDFINKYISFPSTEFSKYVRGCTFLFN
tara:strand:- start:240 stop:830 length:591 start_codon:yes stop_codon:yes gene_type:complete